MQFFVLLNLFSIALFATCDADLGTLKGLFIVHRHGDRSPLSIYPNDPYKENYWPEGLSQLTAMGKDRMYRLGKYIRNRYGDYLSDDIKEVKALSSDKDRCIESVLMSVSGAYPPQKNEKCDENILRLVPVHTNPQPVDSMLNPDSICPVAEKAKNQIFESEHVKEFDTKNDVLYKYLTDKSGKTVLKSADVLGLDDTFVCEQSKKLPLPRWVTPTVLNQTHQLRNLDFNWRASTRKLQRLRSGVFLNDLLKKMELIIKNKTVGADDEFRFGRANFYSTHDYFISVLLKGLGVFNGLSPPFGATVFFELHEHNTDQNKTDPNNADQHNKTAVSWDEANSIAIFYLNETETNEPYPLILDACLDTDHCTIKQFASAVSDLVLTRAQWVKECNGDDDDVLPSDYNPLLGRTYKFNKGDLVKGVCLIVVATLAIVFAVLITINYFKTRRFEQQAFKQKLLN